MSTEIQKKLAKNLRRIVTEKEISLEKFAYENQISKGYIYDVANAKANCSITMLEKIAKGLKVKPEELIK